MPPTVHRILTDGGFEVAVHDFGGPKHSALLFLPANGFHGLCYEPMVHIMRESFHCLALDFPDQGASTPAPEHDNVCEHFATAVLATVNLLRLRDCYIFGHSIGGLVALLLECRRPGLFSCIFCWEAVLRDPQIRWYDNDANGDLTIAALTRKRKRRFSSKAEAAYSYMGKIPFRYFRGDVLRQYVEHGFRPCPDGGVELCCSPAAEARCFNSVDKISAEVWDAGPKVTCPVISACGLDLSPQNFFTGPQTAAEPLSRRLGNAVYEQHEHLTHLGPMQQPGIVAERCLVHFRKVQAAKQHALQPLSRLAGCTMDSSRAAASRPPMLHHMIFL